VSGRCCDSSITRPTSTRVDGRTEARRDSDARQLARRASPMVCEFGLALLTELPIVVSCRDALLCARHTPEWKR